MAIQRTADQRIDLTQSVPLVKFKNYVVFITLETPAQRVSELLLKSNFKRFKFDCKKN